MENLMRPHQVKTIQADIQNLTGKLSNPQIQDKGNVVRQLRRLQHQAEVQTPKPYESKEMDSAIAAEATLREDMLRDMPSQEEMRKSPPGAVGKHIQWEKRNKKKLLQWKNIQLRLNAGTEDPDVANFERFRPKDSSLNMDNALIPGQKYFMPSEQYKQNYDAVFRNEKPEENTEEEVKIVSSEPKKKGRKSPMSQEERLAASARMKARHAESKKQKEARAAPESPQE